MCVFVFVLSDMAAGDCPVFLPVDATDGISVSTQPLLSLFLLNSSGDRYVAVVLILIKTDYM